MTEVALVDAKYVSRYGDETVGIYVQKNGVLTDADGNDVAVSITDVDAAVVVASGVATRLSLGTYTYRLSGALTNTAGHYAATFSYTVDAVPDTYAMTYTIGEVTPAYDVLSGGFKDVVESVWVRFADLYDSPYGGPHLQVYMQTHFGRNRLAQLLRQAIGRLNTIAQPTTTYGLGLDFPFPAWGALLEQALYVEVVKHLVRSYTEVPEVSLGASIARLDRSGYQGRWQIVLGIETEDLERMLDNFKIAHMGLGAVHVLVSGGAFGRFGPTAPGGGAGQAAARGYFAAYRNFT